MHLPGLRGDLTARVASEIPGASTVSESTDKRAKLRICVIGAGCSGILALVQLKSRGFTRLTAFEKGADVGGTWWFNRYPGIACDVPSLAYQYSFCLRTHWSHHYASGDQIQRYIGEVADQFDVRRHVQFGEEVTSAVYEEGRWLIETRSGRKESFDVVISAVGFLHHPKVPVIDGASSFEGFQAHSRDLPADYPLGRKRVGIIGTGSTAVQLVTAVAPIADRLTVFQRTAQWILPLPQGPITEDLRATFDDEAARRREYDRLNLEHNSTFAAAVVNENPEAYRYLSDACRNNLQETIRDPVLRAKLTPDYEVGCKRLVMAQGFYEALQRPNVDVVTEKISAIDARGILTADGTHHALDVIVYATGFDVHAPYGTTRVIGKGGMALSEAWKDGASAYKQVMMASFPNWFMLGGPGSPIGNFSFLFTAEHQCRLILDLIELLVESGAKEIGARKEAQVAFNEARAERMKNTVWMSGCTSWYLDKNGNIPFWPWSYQKFQDDMNNLVREDFEILGRS